MGSVNIFDSCVTDSILFPFDILMSALKKFHFTENAFLTCRHPTLPVSLHSEEEDPSSKPEPEI